MKNILIIFGLLFSVSVFSQGVNNDTSLIMKYDKYIFISGDEKDVNENVEGGEVYMDNDVYTIYYNFLKTSDLAVFYIKNLLEYETYYYIESNNSINIYVTKRRWLVYFKNKADGTELYLINSKYLEKYGDLDNLPFDKEKLIRVHQ